jgi:branched-chain amino acid transport system substrate-binding protein
MIGIYLDALKKVGDPTNHKAIAAAIGETDKLCAMGRIQFDPKTHLTLQDNDHIPILFFQIWDGKRNLISPPQYVTGEFQTPPWMKK